MKVVDVNGSVLDTEDVNVDAKDDVDDCEEESMADVKVLEVVVVELTVVEGTSEEL